jgi:hypothetical protein
MAPSSLETAKTRLQFIKACSPEKKYEVVDLSSDDHSQQQIDLHESLNQPVSLVEEHSNSINGDIATFAAFQNS